MFSQAPPGAKSFFQISKNAHYQPNHLPLGRKCVSTVEASSQPQAIPWHHSLEGMGRRGSCHPWFKSTRRCSLLNGCIVLSPVSVCGAHSWLGRRQANRARAGDYRFGEIFFSVAASGQCRKEHALQAAYLGGSWHPRCPQALHRVIKNNLK